MSREAMEIDPSRSQSMKQKADKLRSFTAGPFSSSIARLSGSSRGIPSDKDFHFYYNFDEFKLPIKEITDKSQSMLDTIGSSELLWGKQMVFSEDYDDGYEWLVSVNDEVFERFDASVDEFERMRKKEEETRVRTFPFASNCSTSPEKLLAYECGFDPSGDARMSSVDSENGFQLVYGKKKKGVMSQAVKKDGAADDSSSSAVKVASRDKKTMGTKPKVPFHIPTIPRPQDQYKILVNNSNQPFEHVWLERSEDGSRFIHPLEKFFVLDFVDKNVCDVELINPPPIECTPFKLVEEVKDLKELAAKLHGVNEFAVDLEHNQYRTFQGLTCLMQISTRTDDFVVDTLKLRIHIGPYLREVFKDHTKKKVMHGADRDIVWLQRDFGIYICNLFDTGQASRELKLERNSLEYLLHHFCGVKAKKEYQNADWRLRPLPDEMLRYAREDTHYLLHIYDLMRIRLLSSSPESENSETHLLEVYKRSYDVCMQLYEKEVLTDSSFLHIYGVQGADFNAQQLAIVAGLCEWRDVVARAEDESTGYILPNKTLLEIAKQMPFTTSNLRRMVWSKHPYIERNLGSVVSIIRHSVQNASAFEAAAEHLKAAAAEHLKETAERLKEGRVETASDGNIGVTDGSEALHAPEAPTGLKASTGAESVGGSNTTDDSLCRHPQASVQFKERSLELRSSTAGVGRNENKGSSENPGDGGNVKSETDGCIAALPKESFTVSGQIIESDANTNVLHSVSGATIQVLRKPTRAFGAMLGNSAAKRKYDPGKKEKEEIKLEQIKSSVNLPFHSFLGQDEQLQSVVKEPAKPLDNSHYGEPVAVLATSSNLEEIILLEADSNVEETVNGDLKVGDDELDHKEDSSPRSALEMDDGDETMSLSDLSSSFQKCFQSTKETRKGKQVENHESGLIQLKPFDYEAARKHVLFGEDPGGKMKAEGDEGRRSRLDRGNRRKGSAVGQSGGEGTGDFSQGRRRQAFPASGNRSGTFR